MSQLVFVRHGQASFFSDDYDRLSTVGEEQARVLGAYWVGQGRRFDAVYVGTLERQRRTAEVIGEVYQDAGEDWPDAVTLAGLDEYPADGIMEKLLPQLQEHDERFRTLDAEFRAAKDDRERYRTFHRLLEAVMAEWIGDRYETEGLARWPEFRDGVRGALKTIMSAEGRGLQVAAVSSGGPIGVSVQTAMEAPDIKAAELNWRIYNGSLTEFAFTSKRLTLDRFNETSHFTDPALLTYR